MKLLLKVFPDFFFVAETLRKAGLIDHAFNFRESGWFYFRDRLSICLVEFQVSDDSTIASITFHINPDSYISYGSEPSRRIELPEVMHIYPDRIEGEVPFDIEDQAVIARSMTKLLAQIAWYRIVWEMQITSLYPSDERLWPVTALPEYKHEFRTWEGLE